VVGLYLSFWLNSASGATIVLVETAVFLVALLVGPRTGLFRARPTTVDRAG
jgi:ABC-type Mn2+/Zn2+ transport system permease subunit